MRLDNKMRKKVLSLGLAFGLAVTSIPLWQAPVAVQAAEVLLDTSARAETGAVTLDSVRQEAQTVFSSEKKAFDIDLSTQTFSGTGVDLSSNADYIQVLNNLRTGSDDQTIIIRFKTSQTGTVLLFGAGKGNTTDGSDMIIGLQNGNIRIAPRNNVGGALLGSFTSALSDGNYHTLALSFLPSKQNSENNLRMVVDGGADLYGTNQYAKNWHQTYIPGFNQKSDVEYSALKIGGTGFKTTKETMSGLTGSVDFVTVINKAYTVEELQAITAGDRSTRDDFSVMTASGSRNTWLFTGGTETVADFSKIGTTRNYVGLFEDNLRSGGSYVERGRFVFNTAKRGADVASILANYDTMIAPYGTKAVGIMVGASDYTKGTGGVAAFKTSLQALLDRIYADSKLPFIITPYPSADSSANAQIAAYVEAINEVAGSRTRVVNVSGIASNLLQADGSLSSAGHQTVANAVKSALGISGSTNFAFNLQGGSYTVAKKTDDGAEAQVKEVTAGEDSVQVSVDAASISGSAAQLTYVLKDAKGQEVSGSAAAGKTEFTVGGLKKGETYTVYVYDASRGNVKESYRPVSITVAEGEKGVSQEYEDGNVSVNEKIQSLLTSEKPVTYLFMGDSITHGIVTQGYDNVPQMFAKYLDELGRTDDVVLNTGVSNATIATTLDQIDTRLEQYDPDVVMIMLGTNDTSYNGQNTVTNGSASTGAITVDQFKERYKQLVRKIHENNADSSIVLRVPCEMIVDGPHSGYEEKFAAIYDVADEMRTEIAGLNITVVNHRQEWLDYQANVRNDNIAKGTTYGWLVDNVHPNGRGNMSMFQQIIKELGLYVNTSEMANYEYALDAWTGSSAIAAPVTQRAARASFDMGALSGYTNGLTNVTVTLTADGVSISKTQEYAADGTITLDGLDAAKSYTATVTGKDAANSKEITFNASLAKETDSTATAEEMKELTDSIAEAKALDVSSYPAEAREAYAAAIKAIEDNLVKDTMTVDEVDEALAQIRLAKESLDQLAEDAETARKEAKAELDKALAATEEKHQAGQGDWTEESWAAYDAAYQAAKAANENTTTSVLKKLLTDLADAEGKLAVKKPDPSEPKPNPEQPTPNPEQPVQPVIEEGKVYTEGNYSYKVTSASNLTAEVTGVKKEGLTKITVYNTVNLGGKSYKITSVAASAFKGNKKITSVSIGKNVQTIGKNAFAGCVKLKKVTVKGSSLKQIGSKAFFNCKALKSIVIKSKALKSVGKNALKGIHKKAVIKVPSAKVKAYTKLLAKKGQSKTVRIKK